MPTMVRVGRLPADVSQRQVGINHGYFTGVRAGSKKLLFFPISKKILRD
jgi:hypothetical protein